MDRKLTGSYFDNCLLLFFSFIFDYFILFLIILRFGLLVGQIKHCEDVTAFLTVSKFLQTTRINRLMEKIISRLRGQGYRITFNTLSTFS